MSVVAAAVIGSAVVGGIASNSASKKAAKASQAATDGQLTLGRESNDLTEKMAEQARTDVNRLFGQSEGNKRAGIQAGLDLYGKTIPAQFDQMRQGNLNAQSMLSGSLQQQNNAILGGAPVDYSQYQPQQNTPVDMNMFNVPTPNYTNVDGSDNFTPAPATIPNPDPSLLPVMGPFNAALYNGHRTFLNNSNGRRIH